MYKDDPTFPVLEIIELDPLTFRSDKPQELMEINPNGKVPTFVHGNIAMFESMAILQYMLDEFDFHSFLAPKDSTFRAKFYQFSYYMTSTVDNLTAVSSPIQRLLDDLRPGDNPDLVTLNKRAFSELVGPILSQELSDRDYFYGNNFTALDVVVGYFLSGCLRKRPDYLDKFPNLKKYVQSLQTRGPFQRSMEASPK
ncbi:hypothetical protein TCAL_02071 [Tigriopus californicus]|uniref:Uncharacterized protein n=1 Tax=Tigriopus californicus TaxID=6832 RepID=A0A553NEW3_TIGCA|nr:hypothetical protein TCAL_02071 [Tigriopus californicus]